MKKISKFIHSPLIVFCALASSFAHAEKHLDPTPTPPQPEYPDTTLSRQAGIGGNVAYARSGVMELGGAASYSYANKVSILSISPSVGYFFSDNWELTGTLQWMYTWASGGNTADIFMAVVEPSFNFPVKDTQFAFAGVGLGVANSSGVGFGASIAPRIGYKILVGRSGLLTADIRNTIFSNEARDKGMSNTVAVGLGYTVLW